MLPNYKKSIINPLLDEINLPFLEKEGVLKVEQPHGRKKKAALFGQPCGESTRIVLRSFARVSPMRQTARW